MDLESNGYVERVKTLSNDVDHVFRTQNVSHEPHKRPLEEPEGIENGDSKKCKIEVDISNGQVEPLEMSKRQLKKLQKKQQWLNDKPKRL